jgi:hypothetical protein
MNSSHLQDDSPISLKVNQLCSELDPSGTFVESPKYLTYTFKVKVITLIGKHNFYKVHRTPHAVTIHKLSIVITSGLGGLENFNKAPTELSFAITFGRRDL